ncbi:hypothetical protein N0V84_010413 [Fusarium piperis]|uniref:Uncharacterized protein n=1 Tax=Fusarium piperis TaxID=1435070 RepID=A0A9W8TFI7_9HYPO|nr:hypothetical protein N0V84_010413 [Fusarium piperis]
MDKETLRKAKDFLARRDIIPDEPVTKSPPKLTLARFPPESVPDHSFESLRHDRTPFKARGETANKAHMDQEEKRNQVPGFASLGYPTSDTQGNFQNLKRINFREAWEKTSKELAAMDKKEYDAEFPYHRASTTCRHVRPPLLVRRHQHEILFETVASDPDVKDSRATNDQVLKPSSFTTIVKVALIDLIEKVVAINKHIDHAQFYQQFLRVVFDFWTSKDHTNDSTNLRTLALSDSSIRVSFLVVSNPVPGAESDLAPVRLDGAPIVLAFILHIPGMPVTATPSKRNTFSTPQARLK